MIIYFANRKMEVLGQASTNLPSGVRIKEDLKTEDVETGVATFSCKIPFVEATRESAEEYTEVGNYILRSNDGEHEFYTIIDAEIDTDSKDIYVYAEDAGLDLLNEVLKNYTADNEYTLSYYAKACLVDSGFEIGINECESKKLKLSQRSEETATQRLLAIATQFECEVSFSFTIKDMVVTHKYVNFYEKRGKDLGVQLRLNKEINRLVIKKSVSNLATAYLCTGSTPDGTDIPVTLEGYSYDDGDFYVDGHYLKSRNAVQKWGRYAWADEPNPTKGYDGHIVKMFTYDTVSQQELCKQAISSLKKVCNAEVNYEADIASLPDSVKIGDTVNVIDDKGNLYLSSRILKLEESIADNKRTVTLGDYMIKDSGISEKVEALSNQFAEIAKNRTLYTWIAYANDEYGNGISLDAKGKSYMGVAENQFVETPNIDNPSVYHWSKVKGEDATLLRIDSSRGNVFKNNEVETVLTVTIFNGSNKIEDIDTLHSVYGPSSYLQWSWLRIDDNTYGTILLTDKKISNDGFTLTLNPDDVDTKVTFRCELINE